MSEIKPMTGGYRRRAQKIIADEWGSVKIVTRGRVHDVRSLRGYVACKEEEIQGVITYYIENSECEIVTLKSLVENSGTGSRLLKRVIATAEKVNCKRVWLVTTNDNTGALRFYQKRGFDLAALYRHAVDKSRKIEPEIPERGCGGIPIKHEFELELSL